MVTKIVVGSVSSQRLEIAIPNPLTLEIDKKLLMLIEINKYKVIEGKTFYLESICLLRNCRAERAFFSVLLTNAE